MRCQTVQPLLLDFSSGQLDSRAAGVVAAHLEECASCRLIQQRELEVAAFLRGAAPVAAPADAWSAVERQLHRGRGQRLRWRVGQRSLIWGGGMVAAAGLALGLLGFSRPAPGPTIEPDVLRSLSPSVAAGLSPDRVPDPLIAVQHRLDRLLEGVSEFGS